MEIPNVEMIESSLRCCSITTAGNNRSVDHERDGEITVDLNSEVPLPYPWQQFLNLQTGEVYYVDKTDGTKITHDPRRLSVSNSDSEPLSGIDDDQQDVDTNDTDNYSSEESSDGSNNFNSCSSSPCSSNISVVSTTSSTASTASSSAGTSKDHREHKSDVDDVLVLVGCKVCFTLSMVARSATECAKCGSAVLRRF